LNAKTWFVLGASLGVLAVAAGTFGAHKLPDYLRAAGAESEMTKRLDWWETGVRYQMYHALALFAVAWIADRRKSWLSPLAGGSLFLGTLIFSGCLFALALTGQRWFGMIVPVGGGFFILGWIFLAMAGVGLVAAPDGRKLTARERLLAESKPAAESAEAGDSEAQEHESPPLAG
jgi:uncharacterized membrane protein YgdD (TMEM256/DUF423 family)